MDSVDQGLDTLSHVVYSHQTRAQADQVKEKAGNKRKSLLPEKFGFSNPAKGRLEEVRTGVHRITQRQAGNGSASREEIAQDKLQ